MYNKSFQKYSRKEEREDSDTMDKPNSQIFIPFVGNYLNKRKCKNILTTKILFHLT